MGLESEAKWRKCFGSSSTHRKISAVESAVETLVPNFSPFILPAVLAQLHLDVPRRLFSNVRFVQVSQIFLLTFCNCCFLFPQTITSPTPQCTYICVYICIYTSSPCAKTTFTLQCAGIQTGQFIIVSKC